MDDNEQLSSDRASRIADVLHSSATTRSLPSSLVPIVAALELRQPKVVTSGLLAEIARESVSNLAPSGIAERLVRRGWLLPLRVRDAWEFVPGAHAGRFGWGDPWIELRAVLAHDPDAPVAVAFESAIWELGYTTHQPTKPVLAHRHGWQAPPGVSARSVTYEWRLHPAKVKDLPVWLAATAVVAPADRPVAQGDWHNADDRLPETFRATTLDDVLTEVEGHGKASVARLGYLAEWSHRFDIADALDELLAGSRPVVYLGPRETKGRWANRWHLYDSLLPER